MISHELFEVIQTSILGFAIAYSVRIGIRQARAEDKIDEIKRRRERFYAQLADPKKIQREMEAGARLREMKDANRTTLPREDAVGQNAVVHRPKLRRYLGTGWNPPQK